MYAYQNKDIVDSAFITNMSSISSITGYSVALMDDDVLDYIDYINSPITPQNYSFITAYLTYVDYDASLGKDKVSLLLQISSNGSTNGSYLSFDSITVDSVSASFPAGSGSSMSLEYTPDAPVPPTKNEKFGNYDLVSITVSGVVF